VCASDLYRALGNIARENLGVRNFQRQSHRDAARTGTDIQNPWSWRLQLEDRFDKMLGFGAGNQDIASDAKVAAIEFLAPQDVLKRHAVDAVVKKVFERLRFFISENAFVMRVQIFAFDRETVSEQQLRGQPRVRYIVQFEAFGRRAKRITNGHAAAG